MKFILKTVLKIILYLILLFVPVTIFITFFSLNKNGIPVWNLGIRNVLEYSKNYLLPSLFISYLISTLLAVALADKMKVRSLFLLHIPPLVVGCLLGAAFFYLRPKEVAFPIQKGTLRLGVNNYLRKDVFNDLGDSILYIESTGIESYTVYLYDRNENKLQVFRDMNLGRKKGNHLLIDAQKGEIIIVTKKGETEAFLFLPYRDVRIHKSTVNLKLVQAYENRVRSVLSMFRARGAQLKPLEMEIMLSLLLLSLLMISIPLTYGLNDRGWGFAGPLGALLVLGLLPFLYGFVLKLINIFPGITGILGRYAYLFPAAVYGLIGICLDIAVKAGSHRKR